MIIPIDEKLRIKGTEHCWELQRLRSRKGRASWEPFKYYTSLGKALESAVDREIRLHPAHGIAEAKEAVSAVIQRLADVVPDDLRPLIVKELGKDDTDESPQG